MERLKIRVAGDVQGVFFRYSTEEKARELGLKGWVRNEENGDVLIVAEGAKESLDELVEWAKDGPEMATVENVSVEEDESEEVFNGFEGR